MGQRRIRFDFMFEGRRYRPSILGVPSEANLRAAREHLAGIKQRIAAGMFSFAEEFPDFRGLERVPQGGSPRTCGQVIDEFLAHCEARVAMDDMAAVIVASYRKALNGFLGPRLGVMRFLNVRYSSLVRIADNTTWSKKTYNNAISVLRRAFKFGCRDYPELHNPTLSLKSARIHRKDRAVIDPFTIQDAERLIAAIHADWGEAQRNYDEFRFFAGLRPSEVIALLASDFDARRGTLKVTKACVAGRDKDVTKNGDDRLVVLCPRAIAVAARQLTLRAQLEPDGKIDHGKLFFKANGDWLSGSQRPHAVLSKYPDDTLWHGPIAW